MINDLTNMTRQPFKRTHGLNQAFNNTMPPTDCIPAQYFICIVIEGPILTKYFETNNDNKCQKVNINGTVHKYCLLTYLLTYLHLVYFSLGHNMLGDLFRIPDR